MSLLVDYMFRSITRPSTTTTTTKTTYDVATGPFLKIILKEFYIF
jgi:hypothetical protein